MATGAELIVAINDLSQDGSEVHYEKVARLLREFDLPQPHDPGESPQAMLESIRELAGVKGAKRDHQKISFVVAKLIGIVNDYRPTTSSG